MTDLYLGVDGGGTKTEFVCIDAAGTQLAQVTVGTTYHPEVGFDEAVRRLEQGVATIYATLGIEAARFRNVFFGLPGFGEDSVVDPLLEAACGSLLGHDRYVCGNDMVCGWAGSLACEDGINIVAGTGSIGYGERQGVAARVGGWGEVFGDEGSAYWIAIQGLAAFSRMCDEREGKGPLYGAISDHLALANDIQLIERVVGKRAMTRAEVAALAPIIVAAAADGDRVATQILERAAAELAEMAITLRRKLAFASSETVRVSFSGSILTKVEAIRELFAQLLDGDGTYVLTDPVYTPSYGAALYARTKAKATVSSHSIAAASDRYPCR